MNIIIHANNKKMDKETASKLLTALGRILTKYGIKYNTMRISK